MEMLYGIELNLIKIYSIFLKEPITKENEKYSFGYKYYNMDTKKEKFYS